MGGTIGQQHSMSGHEGQCGADAGRARWGGDAGKAPRRCLGMQASGEALPRLTQGAVFVDAGVVAPHLVLAAGRAGGTGGRGAL
jgi:hypothetical protein